MSHRRWTTYILCIIIALVLGVGAFNYIIDPYRLYGMNIVPPLAIQPRTDKYKLMLAQPESGQIILLGSSRIFLMRPTLVTQLTGLPTFNAAVTRAMPRDYLILTRFAIDVMHPKRIVAAIDLQVFHPTIEWDNGTWLQTSPLRAYADTDVPHQSVEQRLAGLFSLQQTLDSLEAIHKAITAPPAQPLYNADGSVTAGWIPKDETLAEGKGLIPDLDFWYSYDELLPKQLSEIQRFFVLCQNNHITLDVVLMPFDQRALKQLQTLPKFVSRLKDYRDFLQQSAQQYGFTVHDFTDPASFGGDPLAFSDYYHPLQSNVDRLTTALFANAP